MSIGLRPSDNLLRGCTIPAGRFVVLFSAVCMFAGCTFDLPDVRPVGNVSVSDAGGQDSGPLPDAHGWDGPVGVDAGDVAVAPDVAVEAGDGCVPQCQGKCKGQGDTCGGTCPVDDCVTGQVCNPQGVCCTPKTCDDLNTTCGSPDDGCGHSLSCGVCTGTKFCVTKACREIGLQLVQVSAGSFEMGSPSTEPGRDTWTSAGMDETQHHVKLTHAFLMSRTEVTQGTFRQIMGYNPSKFVACGDSCPVEMVSWDEAAAFANKLSEAQGLAPCFTCTGTGKSVLCYMNKGLASPYVCKGYRFPTEAEWEFAARGGTSTAVYSGAVTNLECEPVDPNLASIAWYRATSNSSNSAALDIKCGSGTVKIMSHPVAKKTGNAYGLFDMAGNVWEWTMECPAAYPTTSQTDPYNPTACASNKRVFRGCGMGNEGYLCRHAERVSGPAHGDPRALDIGIRLVKTFN